MDAIRYHSGLSKPGPPDRPVAFEEGMRTFGFLPRVFVPTLTITSDTQVYRPNHLVTIRHHADGWSCDLHGVFRDSAWRFEFEWAHYRAARRMLVLEGSVWMEGSEGYKTASLPGLRDTGV